MEKLTEIYSLRITETLKHMAERLSADQKARLNQCMRVEIARAVHEAHFDPEVYLREE